jgi:signal transduction histidine kinase
MPIWSKLGLIMIVPTIATAVVGTSSLVGHVDTLNNANRAGTLANLAEVSGALVNNLQDERAAAVLMLGATDPQTKQKYRDAYAKLHPTVDAAKAPYSQQRLALSGLPANFTNLLNRIDQSLADLPATRSQVFNGKLKLTDASQSYEALISDLLDMRDSAAQLAGDTSLGERMRAAAAVARSKEFLSMRRIVVDRAIIQGTMPPALRTEYIAAVQGQQQALQTFKTVANRAETELYDQTVSGSDQRQADTYSGWVMSKTTDTMQSAPFTVDEWDAAMVGNAKLIRTVEAKLDSDVVNQAHALRDNVQRQVLFETGLLLGMLLLSILFAWLVARSMARSLRELRHGALSVAQYGLPQAVARLRDPQISAQLSPAQLATQIADPLPVLSKDEFGQVTEAFNAVHLEAVRIAAEQAALRASVATMFVNLARRSQILVDRLIGQLDRLERGEEDPDRLAELFQLDHLATRMRRNDENLLVLAGADSTRVQREPAALIDVLRAAQSEVEHYTRIDFGMVDRDIEVAASAINDLVHLVAELFDNATAFSPPDSQVLVEARRLGDRASLYVEDHGIGITADQLDELNERLATPPMVDVTVSRMMGLVVVARLASRHGVKVELRPGSDRGIVAEVTLPAPLLVPRALTGRVQHPDAFRVSSTQRPSTDPPLALESAPFPLSRPDERNTTPAGLSGQSFDAAPRNGAGGVGPTSPRRSMPAWSDLTGATAGLNVAKPFTPTSPNGRGAEPLPQRRATVEGEIADGTAAGNVPRQIPTNPEAWPGAAGPVQPPVSQLPPPPATSGPPNPAPLAPPTSAPSASPMSAPSPPLPLPTPAAAPPPVWPPVASPDRDSSTPPVPERLAAALDMTAEMPRVTRGPAEVPVSQQPAAENRSRYADETMELPIFRELESAWFRTRKPAPEESGMAASPASPTANLASSPTAQFAIVDPTRDAGATATGMTGNAATANGAVSAGLGREMRPQATAEGASAGYGGSAAARRAETPAGGWQTAADDGWRAASAAREVPIAETTETGLPKRVPMAQLVPGGVEKPANSVQRRTPEGVRGLLSAYRRGVQRGRAQPTDDQMTNPEETPGGQSAQFGLGPAAGSGQKEHEG